MGCASPTYNSLIYKAVHHLLPLVYTIFPNYNTFKIIPRYLFLCINPYFYTPSAVPISILIIPFHHLIIAFGLIGSIGQSNRSDQSNQYLSSNLIMPWYAITSPLSRIFPRGDAPLVLAPVIPDPVIPDHVFIDIGFPRLILAP